MNPQILRIVLRTGQEVVVVYPSKNDEAHSWVSQFYAGTLTKNYEVIGQTNVDGPWVVKTTEITTMQIGNVPQQEQSQNPTGKVWCPKSGIS